MSKLAAEISTGHLKKFCEQQIEILIKLFCCPVSTVQNGYKTNTTSILFDTKKNMKYSWDLTSKRFDLKVPFKNYCQFIGRPFGLVQRSLQVNVMFEVGYSSAVFGITLNDDRQLVAKVR